MTQIINAVDAIKPAGKSRIVQHLVVAVLLSSVLAAGYLLLTSYGKQMTEDAYVDGNMVQVTPQVAGSVVSIAADNTDYVAAGQVLVELNEVDGRLALARAEAQLSRAVRQVRVQFANASQMQANLKQRAADLARATADLSRRQDLAETGAVSGEDISHAENALKSARAAHAAAEQQAASANALVDQTSIASHPEVVSAIAQLREAYVILARTKLRAPVSGNIAKRNVQLGQRVGAGAALMTIVPPEQMWVNANFKESQLGSIRIGQPAVLTADVYGKAVRYKGRVIGQDAGTGSAFSLLPAQNATGNWIKVVQRVPIRIALDPKELAMHPLKLGLSMRVVVDTRDTRGSVSLGNVSVRTPYKTDVFDKELEQADQLAKHIIAASGGDLQNYSVTSSQIKVN